MLSQRYQIALLMSLIVLVSCYLLLPLGASYVLAQGLRDYGYKKVMIQLGYPGWGNMRIPVVSFQQDLGGEQLIVSVTDAEIQYQLSTLRQGHVNRIILRDVAIQVITVDPADTKNSDGAGQGRLNDDESPWSLLTAGDLLRSLPILPFDELQLDHLTIFREQATGPLRKVTIAGSVTYQDGAVGGQLSFQGRDTASYSLTVAGNSASTWSATLTSQRPQPIPIVSWRSQAQPVGSQIQVEGNLEVNVQGLSPFIALLVPIGPELGKVTGQVAINWTGKAAVEASLTSLWADPRTHLDGNMRVNMTLPALKGVAKDIALAYQGTFSGNAMQVEWSVTPGVLLTATINTQPRIIPEAVRLILPHGDQPVRIENKKAVHGVLYWAEKPVRTIAEGPMHVTYGQAAGPLVARFETSRAEALGSELVVAEGAYDVEGVLPKGITDLLAAKEAMGGVRGTVRLARAQVRGVLFPTSSVTAKHIQQGSVDISQITIQLSEAINVDCDVAAPRCVAGPAVAAIRVPAMRVGNRQIRMVQGALLIQQAETAGPAWSTRGTLTVDGLSIDPTPWGLAKTNWAVRFNANQSGVKADLQVDVPMQEGFMTATIEQPFKAPTQGVFHGTVGPVLFNTTEHRLSKFLVGMPRAMDLIDGTFTGTIDATWSGGMGDTSHRFQITSGTAKLVADKIAGHYQDYFVKGLSTTMTLRAQGVESIIMTQPAPITVVSVHTGVELSNLAATFQMVWNATDELPVIDVHEFRCEVFGGSVTSRGPMVDLTRLPVGMTLVLRSLDVAKILTMEQQKGLHGTGTINGALPVTVTSAGVTVKDGIVEAQPPGGVIRYTSSAESSKVISESEHQLNFVTQALNNFHYTLLRIGVRYGENGTLDLNARLEGRNPDLTNTPPIHFNLTVQEHIPTLLKSLRVAEDIQGAIERKYKR